jgi:hypothetical protein
MKKTIKINIWDFINVEEINEVLDEKLKHEFLPTEIEYKISKIINTKGLIELKVKFKKGIQIGE